MARIFIDGFDKYGPAGQTISSLATLLVQNEWNTISSTMAVVAGLSSSGLALFCGIATGGPATFVGPSKTLPANYTRLIGGFRFSSNLVPGGISSNGGGITFFDGTTAQSSVTINATTGTISMRNGTMGTASALITSTASVTANSIHYLEFDVTFGAAAAFQIWLDGISIINSSGNTKVSTNSFANGIGIGAWSGTGGGSSSFITFDDLYLFDTTGTTNNAVLLTNPRIETGFPTADSQAQFTNSASIIGKASATTSSTNAPGANQLFLTKVTPAAAMTLNSVACFPQATSAAAKFKAVVYPDSAGSPAGQSLITSGVEVVGTTAGTTLTSTFASPPALTGGASYWIGFITDTSVVLQQTDTGTTGVRAANTYTSGVPATCPAITTGQSDWMIWGNCVNAAANYVSQNLNPWVGDFSYISSGTVNNEDLYVFPALSTNPAAIYTVAVKANGKRTDTGNRTLDLRTQSGIADSAGSNAGQTPGNSYGWMDSYFDTDPNTGLAWGGPALNMAVSGVKLAS